LTVSPTEIESLSRITIETTGDTKTINQIIKQTAKLNESKLVFSVEPEFSLIREILLVKFASDNKNADKLAQIISNYGAKIVDNTGGCFVVELSDAPHRIDDFLDEVKGFELIEMCRSGAIAMERGSVAYDI
jgi:acetolactate synthase-1/3 small subunit